MIKLPGGGAWKGVPVEPGVLGIGQPDMADQLFRALQLKGPLPNELDRHYQIGITALDLAAAEYRYLRRESLGYIGMNSAATAGQFGFQCLQGVDGKLTVIEQVIITNLNAGAITVQLGTMATAPAAGTTTPGVPRDSRLGVAATLGSKGTTGTNAAPALPARIMLAAIPPGSSLRLDLDLVLAGAAAFFAVIGQAVNLQQATSFVWRERAALSSEG